MCVMQIAYEMLLWKIVTSDQNCGCVLYVHVRAEPLIIETKTLQIADSAPVSPDTARNNFQVSS